MAQAKVVDLVLQHGAVQVISRAAIEPRAEIELSRVRGLPMGPLMLGGAAAVGLGFMSLAILPVFGLWMTSLMLTAGAFLVVAWVAGRSARPAAAAASSPAKVDPKLLAERCRRVRAILQGSGAPLTFEALVEKSRWTKAAMLSTLLHMKEQGAIVEDLSLDSGEWVYSVADPEGGAGLSPMLAERQASEQPEGHG